MDVSPLLVYVPGKGDQIFFTRKLAAKRSVTGFSMNIAVSLNKTFFSIFVFLLPFKVIAQDYHIKYTENLQIHDKDKEPYFGSVIGLATDLDSNIYIFERATPSVLKYNSKGTFIGKIITDGRGPGEIYSIYSYYLDIDQDIIIIADRQNMRFTLTDLNGREVKSIGYSPSVLETPFLIRKYDENLFLFSFSLGREQTLRSVEGIDSLFHFYEVNEQGLERIQSFGDRTYVTKNINYESFAAGLINSNNAGSLVILDSNSILYSPYVYKSVLYFKKNSIGDWILTNVFAGKHWQASPFEEVDIRKVERNREKYLNGKNLHTSYSSDGRVAGYVNLRSAGIFTFKDSLITNFIVHEGTYEDSFKHNLYVEIFSNEFEHLGSKKIYEGKKGEIIWGVSWKDHTENFYLATEIGGLTSKRVKFGLRVDK